MENRENAGAADPKGSQPEASKTVVDQATDALKADADKAKVRNPIPAARPRPAIGRTVHYFHQEWQGRDKENPCSTLPAIITAVHSDDCVDLQIIRNDGQNGGLMHRTSVRIGGPGTIGTWFWPTIV